MKPFASYSRLQKMKKPILNFKRTKRPNRTPVQRLVARPKCRQLLQNFKNSNFILDDESYFTLSNSTLTGNDSYYSNDRTLTQNDVMACNIHKRCQQNLYSTKWNGCQPISVPQRAHHKAVGPIHQSTS